MGNLKNKIESVKITAVIPNKDNPRILKDDKFKKLVNSIKEFPEMLDLRPIVVNKDMIVLGGNMRLEACKKAGLKEVPILMAENLTEEQQREFIIKDNVSFGEWDWDMITNEWNVLEAEDWGLETPVFGNDDEEFETNIQGDDSGTTKSLTAVKYKSYEIYVTQEEEVLMQKAIDKHLEDFGILTGFINQILTK